MTLPSEDVRAIAGKLRRLKGARGACLAMTGEWQFCGKATFSAGGAHSLFWACGGYRNNPFVEIESQKDGKWSRYAYRLTPLGLAVRNHLKESDHARD